MPGLRYPRLEDLIALKLHGGGHASEADVVELLVRNPAADVDAIRSMAMSYGFSLSDVLIAEAAELLRRKSM